MKGNHFHVTTANTITAEGRALVPGDTTAWDLAQISIVLGQPIALVHNHAADTWHLLPDLREQHAA